MPPMPPSVPSLAADFLRGRAVSPKDHATAQIEGWIWAAEGQASR